MLYIKCKATQNTSDKLDAVMHEARNQMPWAWENRVLGQSDKQQNTEKINPEQVVTWRENIFNTSCFPIWRKTYVLDFGLRDLETAPVG